MDEANDSDYYTDVMRSAVAAIPNKHGLDMPIHQMSDQDGPYLTLIIRHEQYVQFGHDATVAREVAQYIIDIHTALRAAGARVTYLVVE